MARRRRLRRLKNRAPDIRVLGINRRARVAVLDDGRSADITDFFDDLNEECGPDEAVTCVAKISDECFLVVDLREFTGRAN